MAIKEMMGPVLNMGSPQSKYAPAFLSLVKDILNDPLYVHRLKRHYQIFKENVEINSPPDEDDFDDFDDETEPAPTPVQTQQTAKPRKKTTRGHRSSSQK